MRGSLLANVTLRCQPQWHHWWIRAHKTQMQVEGQAHRLLSNSLFRPALSVASRGGRGQSNRDSIIEGTPSLGMSATAFGRTITSAKSDGTMPSPSSGDFFTSSITSTTRLWKADAPPVQALIDTPRDYMSTVTTAHMLDNYSRVIKRMQRHSIEVSEPYVRRSALHALYENFSAARSDALRAVELCEKGQGAGTLEPRADRPAPSDRAYFRLGVAEYGLQNFEASCKVSAWVRIPANEHTSITSPRRCHGCPR